MKCLLIVDMQNDFSESGTLPVQSFTKIIKPLNDKIKEYKNNNDLIIATRDWHPKNHISFKSSTLVSPKKGDWPDHCIQNEFGSMIHEDINTKDINHVLNKGYDLETDSYSIFKDADGNWHSEITAILDKNDIKEIEVVGVAGEYCVKFSALDASELKYNVYVNHDLVAYVDNKSKKTTLEEYASKNIKY